MARKGCHVFPILADLATVLLRFRCYTATSWVRALSRSGHTSTSLPSYCRFCEEQGSTYLLTLKAGDLVSWNHTFPPGFGQLAAGAN